ncbi:hypothetical protein J1614_011034 [Plenodomus biglobosus]|nr:hypothetical protein J1614_011034 [Plenodomus biglobosus]
MGDRIVGRHPLKSASKPMTSSSSTQFAKASAGDMVFSTETKQSKVTMLNPLLTPSLLLDPKARERAEKDKQEIAYR